MATDGCNSWGVTVSNSRISVVQTSITKTQPPITSTHLVWPSVKRLVLNQERVTTFKGYSITEDTTVTPQ